MFEDILKFRNQEEASKKQEEASKKISEQILRYDEIENRKRSVISRQNLENIEFPRLLSEDNRTYSKFLMISEQIITLIDKFGELIYGKFENNFRLDQYDHISFVLGNYFFFEENSKRAKNIARLLRDSRKRYFIYSLIAEVHHGFNDPSKRDLHRSWGLLDFQPFIVLDEIFYDKENGLRFKKRGLCVGLGVVKNSLKISYLEVKNGKDSSEVYIDVPLKHYSGKCEVHTFSPSRGYWSGDSDNSGCLPSDNRLITYSHLPGDTSYDSETRAISDSGLQVDIDLLSIEKGLSQLWFERRSFFP
jgi:hypothetical protein